MSIISIDRNIQTGDIMRKPCPYCYLYKCTCKPELNTYKITLTKTIKAENKVQVGIRFVKLMRDDKWSSADVDIVRIKE